MVNKKIILINVALLIIFFKYTIFAITGITLDGSFNDWSDKPSLSDTVGDEAVNYDIITVKWYPDDTAGNLYFYSERSASANSDWSFTTYLSGDLGAFQENVSYKRVNGTVSLRLYNSSNTQVWSASGKWGDIKTPGTKLEFYVPLSYIVSTTNGGYQINASFKSSNDNVPDQGSITISSVSTGPVFIISGVILINLILIIIKRKYKVTI